MPRLVEKLVVLLALAALAAGCKPKIGDDCKISTDCSAAGDRLCDITAPGGYCTVFNCEPGTCPEGESLCIEFGSQRSPACATDDQAPSPYARTFCMAKCDRDSDCRSGYVCQDLENDGQNWGALRIDTDRGNKACVVPVSVDPPKRDPSLDVCNAKNVTDSGVGGKGPGSGADAGGAAGADVGTSGAGG